MSDKEYSLGGATEQRHNITYEPLPYATHPIDTVPTQWQGWGPFEGPYTPWNFQSAKDIVAPGGIDITWLSGNNQQVISPGIPFAVITLMQDRSLDLANNPGLTAVLAQNVAASTPSTSTFSNSSNVQTSGVNTQTLGQHGFFSTLSQWVKQVAA